MTLKNINYNIHEGGYLINYSINNFVNCLNDYLYLYLYDILKNEKSRRVSEFINVLPKFVNIEAILIKIKYNYEDGFEGEEDEF